MQDDEQWIKQAVDIKLQESKNSAGFAQFWREGQAQQGVHSEGAEGQEDQAVCAHCNPVV